jgi:hypothetical protein
MTKDIHRSLKKHMSYGTVTRSELPGDIEDYKITLIKQYYENVHLFSLRNLLRSSSNLHFSKNRVNHSRFFMS